MNSLRPNLTAAANADLAALPRELRPAVLEQLARVAVNYKTCSRRTTFPRPPGWEFGLWVRYPGENGALVEVMFLVTEDETALRVRRVLVRHVERLPGWATNPSEWAGEAPWPVVDL